MKKKMPKEEICPVVVVAGLLSDTWTILIIHNLLSKKSLRFCELERALSGISTRTLTLKLKKLEEKSIIIKNEKGYSLTKIGKNIAPVVKAMGKFGDKLSHV